MIASKYWKGPRALWASLALFPFIASCSPSLDAGAFIAIGISPEKTFIVPGKGTSCVAAATAKASGETATADLSEYRALFDNFHLQWKSPDALTISAMKVTIKGFGIDGGEQTLTISDAELYALLGLENGTIAVDTSTGGTGRPIDINSNSATGKGSSSPYAPCGLHLAGIKPKTGVKAFTAQVKVEVVGYSTSATGVQAPVRQSTTAKAQAF